MNRSLVDADALARWVGAARPDDLLPARLAPGVASEGRPTLIDRVELGGGATLALVAAAGQTLVVPLKVDGAASIRRARPGDGAWVTIADVLRGGTSFGPLVPRRIRGLPEASGERAIDVDQSNDSVVVGEGLVVKLFARATGGPHPAEDLPAHLAEVGSTTIPASYGSIRWHATEVGSPLVATVTDYLPQARDGWDRFLGLALEAIDGEGLSASLDAAGRAGDLVARFHHALATPSRVLGHAPVGTAGAEDVAGWRRAAERLLDEALAKTPGPEGDRLAGLEPRIRSAFAAFDAIAETPVQRLHGDLHVGQILTGPHGDAITDLDGDPLATATERVARRPAARDVAAFVRSLDHVGRLAELRLTDGDRDDVGGAGEWIAAMRARFLDAYATSLRALDAAGLYDRRLLYPFEVAQACHEFVYAARFLRPWLPVADRAISVLVAEDRS